ncbi:3-oxoacyl-[acyl-carrier-protein] reductase [Wickerhamomyces ciferrii]|uniref:3-oxoacyl-[acyl-carrier-protein] reductase n=1 Tax=Wickerhamomyces ciferrii (strain ATCC 14091 / BCRC 22168 / CBS 111 / JCM 3599 / NBRC 0793 / NRRL Y-1031 F-60-10) TaxID=1206466 RepID=K0KCU9_WICCF|nr:3-oxoacyl-[acyl-carrier-protein] reductase [Wickerhamomyces ciferrii]CCH42925.1 3-oxoacyl-[acyl-carrier-protein] reductase [Wickerhamomyces ciferrii]
MSLFSLTGKVVVITGATRGIGQGMAIGLAEAGAELIIVHRKSTDPSSTVEQVKSKGVNVSTVIADVLIDSEVDTILTQSLSKSSTGKIDVLINNAGIYNEQSPAEDSTDETWEKVLQVNITSVYKLSRSFGKYWISNKQKGKIINTASLFSFIGGQEVIAYTASKGAIRSLTQGLSNEWASKGINVNSIVPGFIITDMTAHAHANEDQTKYNKILERIPQGKWGKPEDFKGPIVFLSSEASDYVTGDSLFVDGGFLAN